MGAASSGFRWANVLKKCSADQTSALKSLRSRTASLSGSAFSNSAWFCCHIGTAFASSRVPADVSVSNRPRASFGSAVMLINPLRCKGLSAAVKVVLSIANNEATDAMPAGSGRLSDIISENCPLVSPSGRSASSNRRASARAARCTCRHRQQSRTRRVVW